MKKVKVIFFILLLLLSSGSLLAQEEQKASLYVETGHSFVVASTAFSPDGKILASIGIDSGTIKLWNIDSGQEIATFQKNSGGYTSQQKNSVLFLPDGRTLASLCISIFPYSDVVTYNLTLWDINSGQKLKVVSGLFESNIAISPDGKILAVGKSDKSIELLDVDSGKKLNSLTGHTGSINSITFSPNGKILIVASADQSVKLWDINSGEELKTIFEKVNGFDFADVSPNGKTLVLTGNKYDYAQPQSYQKFRWRYTATLLDIDSEQVIKTFSGDSDFKTSSRFSPDGKSLFVGNSLWSISTGKKLKNFSWKFEPTNSISISPSGETFAVGGRDKSIRLMDTDSGQETKSLTGETSNFEFVAISPNGKTIALLSNNYSTSGPAVRLWEVDSRKELRIIKGFASELTSVAFSTNGSFLAVGSREKTIKLFEVASGKQVSDFSGHPGAIYSISFSPDGKTLAGAGEDEIRLWNAESGETIKSIKTPNVYSIAFSPNGKILASGCKSLSSTDETIKLWNIATGTELETYFDFADPVNTLAFSSDGKSLVVSAKGSDIYLFDIASGEKLKTYWKRDAKTPREIFAVAPNFYRSGETEPVSSNGKFQIKGAENGWLNIYDITLDKSLLSLVILGENDWIVTAPDGRFDTNKSLDGIEGLHWVVNGEIMRPLPIDIFMRQYYEPNLLQRTVKCNEENSCEKEFKPLPSIAEINRVQPKIAIKEIKAAGSSETADVTIEIENVTEDVSISVANQTKKKQLVSGAFDLRLFRDGQLVGVSAPKEKLEKYIKDAPRLISETKASGKLIDTPEDVAWRAANDVFALKGKNVKVISPTKVEYTFRNIKLPKDGNKSEAEFTAYAFNADKVKSLTTEPFRFAVPNSTQTAPKKGRAVVVSIGVNASENPAFNLRYAANDARKMQAIVGAKLKSNQNKYSEVIEIPIISDGKTDKYPAVNDAQKAIIKGVFSLLAGNEKEISEDTLKQIPNREKIKAIEPEDTLIITYAGHGYADQAGIFYLLPSDIGKNTRSLTPEALQKMISSDELSLWMQNITASEMIMVIDACHSSAAVQGDGFKPGPMGSRGLGQLAYDKDMKILSATQANNVALELNSLEQGLLSYALLQDGIVSGLADSDKDKQLFSDEWLSYAERRVPELYQEVKDGKRGLVVNGREVNAEGARSELAGGNNSDSTKPSNQNLQQPTLFDFKRRKREQVLLNLGN